MGIHPVGAIVDVKVRAVICLLDFALARDELLPRSTNDRST